MSTGTGAFKAEYEKCFAVYTLITLITHAKENGCKKESANNSNGALFIALEYAVNGYTLI